MADIRWLMSYKDLQQLITIDLSGMDLREKENLSFTLHRAWSLLLLFRESKQDKPGLVDRYQLVGEVMAPAVTVLKGCHPFQKMHALKPSASETSGEPEYGLPYNERSFVSLEAIIIFCTQ